MADPVLKVIVDFTDGLEFDEVTDIADISDLVLSTSIRRGRTTALDVFETGTATVSFKDDTGDWAPDNLSSIYAGKLKPMRKIIISGIWEGTDVLPIFYGYITNFNTLFPIGTDEVNRVTLSCVDAFKILSNSVVTSVSGTAAGDTTDERFGLILDQINWPPVLKGVTPGTNTVQADDGTQRNVLEALRLLETSEYGAMFISKGGEVTFYGQADLDINIYDPVYEFADDSSALPYTDMKIGHDDSLLYNDITVFAPSIADAHVSDSASQTKYFTRAAIRNTINDTLAGSTDVAENLLNFTKNTDVRVDAISVSLLGQSSEAFPYAYLLANIMDPIKVTRQMPGSYVFEKYLLIQGIDHDISPNRWDVTFKTSNPYFSAPSGYYLASLLGDNTDRALSDITTDSTGNAYVLSHDYLSSHYSSSVMKIDLRGNQTASNRYYEAGTSTETLIESINMDSAGNIYLVGNHQTYGSGGAITYSLGMIIKTDPAGTIIWQKEANQVFYPDYYSIAKFMGIDSSDNIYIIMDGAISSGRRNTLIKFNSAGTVQWQKQFAGGGDLSFTGAIDSSDNIYLVQNQFNLGSTITKINSSGTVQWCKTLADYDLTAITADSSGNIYVGGTIYSATASYTNAVFLKYDSTGTIVWSKELDTYTTRTANIQSMCFNSNKVYFIGDLDRYYGILGQLNIDGDLTWINAFDITITSSSILEGLRIVSKSSGAVVFTGLSVNLSDAPISIFGRVPSDGSKATGDYELPSGNIIAYNTQSGATSDITTTEGSATITLTTGTVTIGGSTFSVATTSITSESVEML
jgi:hypothetical protein